MMRQSTPEPVVTRDGDRTVVEASTAAQALATVQERLGAGAEIIGADKVLRGGLWGFFPKEHVQLTVRTPQAPPAARETVPATAATPERDQTAAYGGSAAPTGLAAVLAHLSETESDREEGLGSALRRHLGVTIAEDDEFPDDEASESPAPAASDAPTPPTAPSSWTPPTIPADTPVVGPAPAADVPPVTDLPRDDVESTTVGGAAWSGRNLVRLGLPRTLVDAVLAQDPDDDASWLHALARVLTPLCRPLPTGAAVVAGPRAERFARVAGLPLVRMSSAPRGQFTFGAAVKDTGNGRAWLRGHRGDRWVHVLAGGSGWRGLLFDDPLAISWVGDEMLGEAIRSAHELGLVLGYGLSDADTVAVRATPVDVAVAVRSALVALR